MTPLSRPTASKTASSLSTTNAGSFDPKYNYLSSPPLAYAKEGSATCISFHFPPPPPSPTTEYEQRMERQMYHGQCSPASSSLSTRSILSPPPITDRLSAPGRESDNKLAGGLEFDSNIQHAYPLNPFMTPSAGFLWNYCLFMVRLLLHVVSTSMADCRFQNGRPSPGGASLTSTQGHFSKAL